MSYRLATLAEKPELAEQVRHLNLQAWPEFLRHDAVCGELWPSLFNTFARFQLLLCDADGTLIALGHTIPVAWDGTSQDLPSGIDGALERGVDPAQSGRVATTLSALAAVVAPHYQGQGFSMEILRAMQATAAAHRFKALIAPVRPTLKARYPLTPMEHYVRWTRADGSPLDPWLRVHWRLGAELLQVALQSMVVTGTVAAWEAWTDMAFPESGPYVVPGALQPVNIDRERDNGRYEEPNVWMRHATS